jgi:hypothetical protein
VTGGPDDLAAELCDVVLAALIALATMTGGTPQAESRLAAHVAAVEQPAPRAANRLMTAHAVASPARPPMRVGECGELADEVAAACHRHGVAVWSEHDRDRLAAALWRFIHSDLAHRPADPYADPED